MEAGSYVTASAAIKRKNGRPLHRYSADGASCPSKSELIRLRLFLEIQNEGGSKRCLEVVSGLPQNTSDRTTD
jgi:hypothetical protein